MASLIPYLIVSWLVVAVVLFRRLPAGLAVLVVATAGVLFLPEVHTTARNAETPPALPLPIVKFSKTNTISYALLLGSLLFDRRRWSAVYPRWYDVPIALWCVAPMFPTVINRIGPFGGLYEGVTITLQQTLTWGVPYWLGRLYLASRDGLRVLAGAVVLGGLVYVPFCLFEQFAGPQLHRLVYGYHQHDVGQAVRGAGYRPMVFMEHGLAVSFWMVSAALIAFWLWREGTYRVLVYHPQRRPFALGTMVLVLTGTAVLCRSAGALVLGAVGLVALAVARRYRTALPIAILAVIPPIYVSTRATEMWTGNEPAMLFREYFDVQRAESLEFRLDQESILLDRAREKPIFGWGFSGEWRVKDAHGEDVSVSDSLWIITFATTGGYGLMMVVAAVLLPVARFLWHYPPSYWQGAADAPAAVLATVLTLYMLDHLVNAMLNPVFMLAAGGLAGAAIHLAAQRDMASESAQEVDQ